MLLRLTPTATDDSPNTPVDIPMVVTTVANDHGSSLAVTGVTEPALGQAAVVNGGRPGGTSTATGGSGSGGAGSGGNLPGTGSPIGWQVPVAGLVLTLRRRREPAPVRVRGGSRRATTTSQRGTHRQG